MEENRMITAYPTQRIGNAAVQALVRQELERQRAAELENESRRSRRLRRQVDALQRQADLRRDRDARRTRERIGELAAAYPPPKPGSALGNALWGALGLVVLALGALGDLAREVW